MKASGNGGSLFLRLLRFFAANEPHSSVARTIGEAHSDTGVSSGIFLTQRKP